MSHIVTVETELRDPISIAAACRRLGLEEPIEGIVKLFSGEATGLLIQLPGWQYPVVCCTDSGQIRFDNFQGRWGKQEKLDQFLQAYGVEKVRLEGRRAGHTVTEQPLADGSIKLTVQVGGGI